MTKKVVKNLVWRRRVCYWADYIGNDGLLGEMGWDLSREMTGTF